MYCRHHTGPELAGSARQPSAPIHVIHAGPRSTGQVQGYEDIPPAYYETDIRPGESVVMPGFTISIEAAGRGQLQQVGADGQPPSQPVVTVTPAEGGGHLMTISEQDFLPRHGQDQQQQYHHHQQQQPTPEHHPLSGVIRGQQTRQPVGDERGLYRETDGSLEQDKAIKMPPQQRPASLPYHPGGVGYSGQQVPGARSQPGEVTEQQRQPVDNRGWAPQSGMVAGLGRHAASTETRPAIDNVQVIK